MTTLKFPEKFYWGSATSSHQVEGDNRNDWSEWEKQNADRLASEAKGKFGHLLNWERIRSQAENPTNYISGTACDHYHRFREDFDMAKSLGHNAHRFSIEWSRIEPEEGKFDEKEIEHYRQVILALRERGLEPFVTLWHWTLPVWLAKKGGVESKDFPKYFTHYAEYVVFQFKDLVKFWITLNEPDVQTAHAYLKGAWPPQKKFWYSYLRALHNLIKSHKLAYKKIKNTNPNAQIGIAKHQVYFELAKKTAWNKLLKFLGDFAWNFYFLNKIKNFQDFIGLNHYNRNIIDGWYGKNPNKIQTDLGWEYCPKSIYNVLIELKKYNKPIYITENGLADASDKLRQKFILSVFASVHSAISDGADVRGYFYWSLLDNFEWDKGFWPRFGLIEVDFQTQKRAIRPSAYEYAKIIKAHSLEI